MTRKEHTANPHPVLAQSCLPGIAFKVHMTVSLDPATIVGTGVWSTMRLFLSNFCASNTENVHAIAKATFPSVTPMFVNAQILALRSCPLLSSQNASAASTESATVMVDVHKMKVVGLWLRSTSYAMCASVSMVSKSGLSVSL
jgi:hypothetical protein